MKAFIKRGPLLETQLFMDIINSSTSRGGLLKALCEEVLKDPETTKGMARSCEIPLPEMITLVQGMLDRYSEQSGEYNLGGDWWKNKE